MEYELRITEYPKYLHATATGPHTAENALRFLEESMAACRSSGRTQVLLEMNFSGPSLDSGSIFSVVAKRAEEGRGLRRVAWVDGGGRDPVKIKFAETVALNRGVNIKLFADVAAAKEWLEQ